MTVWHNTYERRCDKCGKLFRSGCPWRKFCPESDCFSIWRREKYRRYKQRWRYEHPTEAIAYNAFRRTPEQTERRRAYERSPARKARIRDCYYARKAARELGGLSTRDVLIQWGLPPGNVSRRVYAKPEEPPCTSTLPTHWKDAVSV